MVVNTILTKEVCRLLTTAEYKWDIKRAMEDWGCWINLIPYIIYDDKLTPKRSDIFDALLRVDEQIDGYLKRYIENLDLDQDKYVYTYDKNSIVLHNGNLYKCLLSNSGNEPPNDTYWEVMIPGVGYELIYILTDSENTPDTPTGDNPSG